MMKLLINNLKFLIIFKILKKNKPITAGIKYLVVSKIPNINGLVFPNIGDKKKTIAASSSDSSK